MPLRFPNPGSDMKRLVQIYRIVHKGTRGSAQFDLDEMSGILTAALQASSSGAVGATALERSNRPDRSRDPLYNQSKMYSEVFRMLGWMRPAGNKRLLFQTTLLGDELAEEFAADVALTRGLFRESVLGICFPNPATNNVGVVNQRPFKWLLRLMAELDGVITRHEMILGLLAVTDDLAPNAFDDALDRVKSVRGKKSRLMRAVNDEAKRSGITLNTLENYTRFPVGVMKAPEIGWGCSRSIKGLYERPATGLVLSEAGQEAAQWARNARDLREGSLAGYSIEERAAFATRSFCGMLIRAGISPDAVEDQLNDASESSAEIIRELGLSDDPRDVLYSPEQQAPDEVLILARSA